MATASSEQSVVVITGGASRIGASTAEAFARRGWIVYATDIDSSFQPAVAASCRCLELDVTDTEACQSVVDRILDETGRIDVLVNNAGYAVPGPVEDVPVAASRRLFDVVVHGTHAMTQAVLPAMRERQQGRIVMVSSVLGVSATPGVGTYGAAKAAVESLTDSLRMELRETPGVSVSLVEPAWVDTEFSGTAADQLPERRTPAYSGVYETVEEGWVIEGGPLAAQPETVASTVVAAATADSPAPRYPVGRLSQLAVPGELTTRIQDAVATGFNRASVTGRRLWEFAAGSTSKGTDARRLSTGQEVSLPLSTQASISGVILSASAQGVDALLPDSLTPVRVTPRRGAVTLVSVEYSRIGDGEIEPYNEVAVMIPAVPRSVGSRLPVVSALSGGLGGYVWQLPVTTEPARALGAEIWGLPKSVAEIDISTEDGLSHTTLTADGQRVFSLAVDQPPTRSRELSLSAYSMRGGGLCRFAVTLAGQLGVRPLSSRADWAFGDHPWAETLDSLAVGSRPLARFGGDCEATFQPPEVVDTA